MPLPTLYDIHPPHPYSSHLPFSREPYKFFYVLYRLTTTLLLVPCWVAKYTLFSILYRFFSPLTPSKSHARRLLSRYLSRPRPSWSLRQVVYVGFIRRMYKVTEVADVTWGTRGPSEEPAQQSMKETAFVWAPPLREVWRTGVLGVGTTIDGGRRSAKVEFKRVGCFVWPKEEGTLDGCVVVDVDVEGRQRRCKGDKNKKLGDKIGDIKMVGVFMHGGGYSHMSAHECSRTSRIPRGLIKRHLLHAIYSLEYLLLQHAPFPAALMDAAAVYAHVLDLYAPLIAQGRCKVILVGDSSGGHLALALARWVRDEGHLRIPDGLLLFSPSCDPSHHLPETLSSYIPRPNKGSDYLVDTIEPRALLQRTFLGFDDHPRYNPKPAPEAQAENDFHLLMTILHSEYVSPCSPVVLKRWGHDVQQDPEGERERVFLKSVTLGEEEMRWMAVWTGNDKKVGVEGAASSRALTHSASTRSPFPAPSHSFPSLFSSFPRTFVSIGTAERLTHECASLVRAMEKDGVEVRCEWVEDACHDVLMVPEWWWNKPVGVLEGVWRGVGEWVEGI